MKIIWLTRIRNEEEIIQDCLEHLSNFCTWWVYIYDDKSTDKTVEICKKHKVVKWIIEWKEWIKDREKAEYENRQLVLELAQKHAWKDDWFLYIDADERIEFDRNTLKNIPEQIIWIKMKLFDFYITKEDKNKNYKERKYIWPEYREILIIFRNTKYLKYSIPDQREVFLWYKWKTITKGYIKHYWKSISIQQWEDTCEYYSKHFPKYAKKWKSRKWKAIHNKSDFWNDLITWEEKESKWIALWKIEIKWKSIFYKTRFYTIKFLVFIKYKILKICFNTFQ